MKKNTILIIGKTNVGKSTLINNLSKDKISITTPKKNTTTQCITSEINKHITIIDTPGPIIKNDDKNINKLIYTSINQASKLLIVIDKIFLNSEDFFILELTKKIKKEKVLLINKIDLLKKKSYLMPFIEKIKKKYKTIQEIIPISNKKNINITEINKIININKTHKQVKNLKIFISETTRETLLNKLEKEIPYTTKINVLNAKINKNVKIIILDLLVKKQSHKKIIIGKNGKKINEIITDIKNKLIKKLKYIEKIKITINVNKK